MIKNYIKTASRNIIRHKGYSFITIAGLAIGMACSFLILMWVQDELGYDRFNENIDDLYRVAIEDHDNNEVVHLAVTPAPLAPTLKEEFPEIARASRFANGQMVMKYGEKVFDESGVVYADPDILEMFTFPLAEGDPGSALSDPHSIIVTEEMSEKYFGNEDPIGKVLTINGKTEFTVSAVASDIPYNSSIRFDFLAPFEYLRERVDIDYWSAYRYYTFVQLAPGCMSDEVDEKIAGVCNQHQQESGDYLYLQPVKDIHLYSSLRYDSFGQADIKYVWILTALAVFVLMIACINFMNLTTARSATRAKEVGVRKVIGARRADLVRQFLGESVLMSSIALVLAVGLVELLLPAFNELSAKHLSADYVGSIAFVAGLVCIAIAAGIVSGAYPALLLSSFRPFKVFAGSTGTGARGYLFRKVLVVGQFSLTIALMTGTIMIHNQLDYMKNKSLGFDKEHVVYMPMRGNLPQEYGTVKSELLRDPYIVNVTAAFQLPTNIGSSPGEMDWEGKDPGNNVRINAGLVDYDYFETFNMGFAEGRGFSKEFATDVSEAYVVNEAAVKAMGMESPIGKRFSFWETPGRIIGVVKDFHSQSLHSEINPIVLKLDSVWLYHLFVRAESDNVAAAISSMEKAWQRVNPEYPFEYRFLDETINNLYRAEQRLGKVFNYFTVVAIFIACMGLFGLASFMAQQRRKEIGVRKVLGASVPGIVLLLVNEFGRWVLLANVIAWPVAYLAMNRWLQDFAYRIDIGIGAFLMAGGLAFILALLTVSYLAVRAALANPVESIKYE